MKKIVLSFLLIVPMMFLSSCTVTTRSYSSSVYTPAYYPGSPYYGSRSVYIGYYGAPSGYYWGNRGYWGNRYYWRGYRGYRYGWYGRRW